MSKTLGSEKLCAKCERPCVTTSLRLSTLRATTVAWLCSDCMSQARALWIKFLPTKKETKS